jgi:signal transduction histidine kinase
MEKQWDVFISHASEDQEEFVRPLAQALAQLGVQVWYAEFSLELGTSLSRSIDKGLAGSKFGLVVISKAFISKKWPERELQGLVANQIAGQTVIIPIWLDVSQQDVLEYSPPLADTFALNARFMTAEQITISILKVVRPDIYQKYPRTELEMMVKGKALQELQLELAKVKDELRELIATEVRNIVRFAARAVVSSPISPPGNRFGMTREEMEQQEVRKRIARDITATVLEATEDYLREAQARVIEKTDPQRAEITRKLKPEF